MKIKNIDGNVIYDAPKAATIKAAVEDAAGKEVDLSNADLSYMNLSGATLSGAKLSGAKLFGATLSYAILSGADLSGANLYGADLYGADLSNADLSGSDLYKAKLSGADLSEANLSGADLSGANLSEANLYMVVGGAKSLVTPLEILLAQPGNIRAYKLVNADGEGPFNGGITYEIGQRYEVSDADTDDTTQCGRGINLCTLAWALREWKEGYRVLIAEFTAEDIAAIPYASDGKFRVHRCKIVGEKARDALGWPPKKKQEQDPTAY